MDKAGGGGGVGRLPNDGAFERFLTSAIATIITILLSWRLLLDVHESEFLIPQQQIEDAERKKEEFDREVLARKRDEGTSVDIVLDDADSGVSSPVPTGSAESSAATMESVSVGLSRQNRSLPLAGPSSSVARAAEILSHRDGQTSPTRVTGIPALVHIEDDNDEDISHKQVDNSAARGSAMLGEVYPNEGYVGTTHGQPNSRYSDSYLGNNSCSPSSTSAEIPLDEQQQPQRPRQPEPIAQTSGATDIDPELNNEAIGSVDYGDLQQLASASPTHAKYVASLLTGGDFFDEIHENRSDLYEPYNYRYDSSSESDRSEIYSRVLATISEEDTDDLQSSSQGSRPESTSFGSEFGAKDSEEADDERHTDSTELSEPETPDFSRTSAPASMDHERRPSLVNLDTNSGSPCTSQKSSAPSTPTRLNMASNARPIQSTNLKESSSDSDTLMFVDEPLSKLLKDVEESRKETEENYVYASDVSDKYEGIDENMAEKESDEISRISAQFDEFDKEIDDGEKGVEIKAYTSQTGNGEKDVVKNGMTASIQIQEMDSVKKCASSRVEEQGEIDSSEIEQKAGIPELKPLAAESINSTSDQSKPGEVRMRPEATPDNKSITADPEKGNLDPKERKVTTLTFYPSPAVVNLPSPESSIRIKDGEIVEVKDEKSSSGSLNHGTGIINIGATTPDKSEIRHICQGEENTPEGREIKAYAEKGLDNSAGKAVYATPIIENTQKLPSPGTEKALDSGKEVARADEGMTKGNASKDETTQEDVISGCHGDHDAMATKDVTKESSDVATATAADVQEEEEAESGWFTKLVQYPFISTYNWTMGKTETPPAEVKETDESTIRMNERTAQMTKERMQRSERMASRNAGPNRIRADNRPAGIMRRDTGSNEQIIDSTREEIDGQTPLAKSLMKIDLSPDGTGSVSSSDSNIDGASGGGSKNGDGSSNASDKPVKIAPAVPKKTWKRREHTTYVQRNKLTGDLTFTREKPEFTTFVQRNKITGELIVTKEKNEKSPQKTPSPVSSPEEWKIIKSNTRTYSDAPLSFLVEPQPASFSMVSGREEHTDFEYRSTYSVDPLPEGTYDRNMSSDISISDSSITPEKERKRHVVTATVFIGGDKNKQTGSHPGGLSNQELPPSLKIDHSGHRTLVYDRESPGGPGGEGSLYSGGTDSGNLPEKSVIKHDKHTTPVSSSSGKHTADGEENYESHVNKTLEDNVTAPGSQIGGHNDLHTGDLITHSGDSREISGEGGYSIPETDSKNISYYDGGTNRGINERTKKSPVDAHSSGFSGSGGGTSGCQDALGSNKAGDVDNSVGDKQKRQVSATSDLDRSETSSPLSTAIRDSVRDTADNLVTGEAEKKPVKRVNLTISLPHQVNAGMTEKKTITVEIPADLPTEKLTEYINREVQKAIERRQVAISGTSKSSSEGRNYGNYVDSQSAAPPADTLGTDTTGQVDRAFCDDHKAALARVLQTKQSQIQQQQHEQASQQEQTIADDANMKRFPAQEPTSLYAQFHKDAGENEDDILNKQKIMRARIGAELAAKTQPRKDATDARNNGSESISDVTGTQSTARGRYTAVPQGSGTMNGGTRHNIESTKLNSAPTQNNNKEIPIQKQQQQPFLQELAQASEAMRKKSVEPTAARMSHHHPPGDNNTITSTTPALAPAQICSTNTKQGRMGVRGEVGAPIYDTPPRDNKKEMVYEVVIPSSSTAGRGPYQANQMHGYPNNHTHTPPRQKQPYQSVLQSPYTDGRTPEYIRRGFDIPEREISPKSQHLQTVRSDFLADSPPATKQPTWTNEFESRRRNWDSKAKDMPYPTSSDIFVVDIDYQDATVRNGRPNPEELKQRLTSAKPVPPPQPQQPLHDGMVRPITPRSRTSSLSSVLHLRDINTGQYRTISMENLIRRTPSSSSVNQLPHQFFSDNKSYTSLLETDIDTGKVTERPLVVETDIDKVYNDIPFRTRSMVNLTSSYTLPKYNLFTDDLTKTKSEELLDSPRRQPPKPEMPERKLSEHELRVTQSLGKLNVPKWYKESPHSKGTSQGFLLNRSPLSSVNSSTQDISLQYPYTSRDQPYDTRSQTSSTGYQPVIIKTRVSSSLRSPVSSQPPTPQGTSKPFFQLPSARFRQNTPKELSPIPIKTKEEIKATLRSRTSTTPDVKTSLPMKGPVGVGVGGGSSDGWDENVNGQYQNGKQRSTLTVNLSPSTPPDYSARNGLSQVRLGLSSDHESFSESIRGGSSQSPSLGSHVSASSPSTSMSSTPERNKQSHSEQEMLFSFLGRKQHVMSPADSHRSISSVGSSGTGLPRAGKDGAFPVLSLGGAEMERGSKGDLHIEWTDTSMMDPYSQEARQDSQITASLEEVIDGLLALPGSPPTSMTDLTFTVAPAKIKPQQWSPLAESPGSSSLATSKEHLEGTYTVSGEDENRPTEDANDVLGQEVIMVKCRNKKCGKTIELEEAKQSYKTCHNCYTYYCGRECRKAHWEKHKKKCVYSRINSACKHVIKKVHDDPDLQYQLSRIARTGYLSQGRGCVMLPFHSPDDAERFLTEGLSALAMPPTYVASKEMGTAGVAGDHLLLLNEMSKNYNPEMKLVLNVAIVTGKEVPAKPHPRRDGPVIKKCAKLRLSAAHVNPKASDEDEPETLILTAVPGSAETENMEARKAREICFINIQRKLRQKGVSLRHQYPDVYDKLCAYVSDNSPFTPITIYPVDVNSGKKFMCMIMPNSEPEVEWMNKPNILKELDLSMDV